MFEPPACAAHELREIAVPDALDAYARLRAGYCPWLLDSALRVKKLGRYSFVGADPYLVLRVRGRALEVECRRAVHPGLTVGCRTEEGSALEAIRSLLPPSPATSPPVPFAGGAVGYLGYELAQQFDAHVLRARDDLGLPDAQLLFVDSLLAFDHGAHKTFAIGLGFGEDPAAARAGAKAALRRLEARLAGAAVPTRASNRSAASAAEAPLDLATHVKAVDAIQEEIAAGNVYQACLTHRIGRPFAGDPWQLYRALRRINPAPFACCFELPELAIVGSSPERFVRAAPDGAVESRPIKGTAPRGRSPEEDDANRRALAASAKDRAENLMIVDLVRNDLGRVCETGSVHVPELMAIEAYASVFQMVSTIRGRLRPDCDVLDLVRATFPPGSMTGAPKIAAMRLLDRLESVRRVVYSGAIGYLDARGGADLSVVIRTLFLCGGAAYLHAGGGIVADSDPLAEYDEALDKLRPLLLALDEVQRAGR
ncbi:MAG TPA: aminodeoxychorismate synthase component I [Myxococcota bacterium]